MFIQDIEFIDPLSEKDRNDYAITGGASAVAVVDSDADDSGVYATAEVKATGNRSKAIAKTKAKLRKKGNKKGKKGYVSGYAGGYGSAYGADSDSVVTDFASTLSSIF